MNLSLDSDGGLADLIGGDDFYRPPNGALRALPPPSARLTSEQFQRARREIRLLVGDRCADEAIPELIRLSVTRLWADERAGFDTRMTLEHLLALFDHVFPDCFDRAQALSILEVVVSCAKNDAT